jgi:hypothetical protein
MLIIVCLPYLWCFSARGWEIEGQGIGFVLGAERGKRLVYKEGCIVLEPLSASTLIFWLMRQRESLFSIGKDGVGRD